MWLISLQDHQSLETIDHNFVILVHIYMAHYSGDSIIEHKNWKFSLLIEHPHDWTNCGIKAFMKLLILLCIIHFFHCPLKSFVTILY
jgi:hypothetical protein